MAEAKISYESLVAEIHVIARVESIERKESKDGGFQIFARIRFGLTSIFIYEKKPNMMRRIEKYKKNDVLEIWGNLVSPSYKGMKSRLVVIDDIKRIRKLGIVKNK